MPDLFHLLPIFCLLAAAGAAPPAADGSWLMLRDDDRTTYRLDLSSPDGPPASRTCRIRRTFKVHDERAYALDTVEIDCLRNSYRYRTILVFDSDDLLMHRYTLTDQFCGIPGDSFLNRVREEVCGSP